MNQIVPFPAAAPAPDELIAEKTVLERRRMLSPAILKAARKAETITYTVGKQGSHWYRLADVDAFLLTREVKCRAPSPLRSSNSPDTGSQPSPDAATSTTSGLTPDLEGPVVQALAQQI